MPRLWRFRNRCAAQVRDCGEETMLNYLQDASTIHPGYLADTPLIVADLELTGLDVNDNRIIAIGWTLVDSGRIRMGANRHLLVKARHSVGDSATIHELTDSEVAGGLPPATALSELFDAAAGRVWVFHHGSLDVKFLRQACLEWCGVNPPFVFLDTMQMELSSRNRRGITIHQGDMQLSVLREMYHLPRYTAHNALNDALATAELLLAMVARQEADSPFRIKKQLQYA